MIYGIGIDLVEIDRFKLWHTYSDQKIQRIFSREEILYCKSSARNCAERFAARFALREAAYKACAFLMQNHQISFLKFCRAVRFNGGGSLLPQLEIDWKLLHIDDPQIAFKVSLTHTQLTAGAVVIANAL